MIDNAAAYLGIDFGIPNTTSNPKNTRYTAPPTTNDTGIVRKGVKNAASKSDIAVNNNNIKLLFFMIKSILME